MKIGIFGGSFDPIHNGHLNVAMQAKNEYDLDQVWFIPAGHSPNKDETKMTSAEDRLAMCQLAVKNQPDFLVSDIEIQSIEKSYTYRTLEKISMNNPQDTLYFLMGADSLDYLEKWVHPEIICRLARILVVNRDDFTNYDLQLKIKQISSLFSADIMIVHCNKYDVSSHEIRNCICHGKSISTLVPHEVEQYIKDHRLFQ